jgi:hypothetical protein
MEKLKSEVKLDLLRIQFALNLLAIVTYGDYKIHLGLMAGGLLSWWNFCQMYWSAVELTPGDVAAIRGRAFRQTVGRLVVVTLAVSMMLGSGLFNPYSLFVSLFSVQLAVMASVVRARFFTIKTGSVEELA